MKTLHKFIIKSFLGPFLMTFCIALFILLMQFLWKYIDDLVGKGLEWYLIAELLLYASSNLVPMALPLAMLLSSIMTFGNLGEHYELVAMKSAGISLGRIFTPLIGINILICTGAFYFSNNILPVSNLKFGSLLYDITHQKPAIDIKEGVFYNGIDGFSIRIGKKEQNGTILKNILIYDHTQRIGNSKLLTAESGTMTITGKNDFLILHLFDGYSYEEQKSGAKKNTSYGFTRTGFKEELIRIGLSDFKLTRTDEELFKDNYAMLNLRQLNEAINEIEEDKTLKNREFKRNFASNFHLTRIASDSTFIPRKIESSALYYDSLFKTLSKAQINQAMETTLNMARNAKSQIESNSSVIDGRDKYKSKHLVEWHKKFTLPFACMILFFIGAPLGAIIRKGGLGMPLVVSVLLFIVFHVLSTTGEKMVKEGVVNANFGMWLASGILLPVGIYLTYMSTQDSSLLDLSVYTDFLKKIGKKKTSSI